MIPEFGHFALILAFCLSLLQCSAPLFGIYFRKSEWISLAKPLAIGQSVFVILSFILLMAAFILNDFSVWYIAQNSNRLLPLPYRMCAVWGAHEGSMLLWATILSVWSIAVACFSRTLPKSMQAKVLAILGIISAGFLLFILATSNPFIRLLPDFPVNGQDLNPLLQDPGFLIHPPILYMGYVGFAVAFSFALASLLDGKVDANWVRWARPWTLAAWCFLTWGIVSGSWWAYRELGWGGWWFWDPVENASLMPWLMGTALIHCLIVTEKRNAFKLWTILLAITAFSLSLLGTFLVRSGVLTSVHAFTNDPSRGIYMLLFLCVVIGGSLLLYALRAARIRSEGEFSLLSRETLLLCNNMLLLVMMITILIGTLYPLILDALNLEKISVGPPYFNSLFIPFSVTLLFLMGIGPYCYWKEMPVKKLWQKIKWNFLVSILLGLIIPYLLQHEIRFHIFLATSLVSWVVLSVLPSIKVRYQWGMMFAHIGMAVTTIGICWVSTYQIERDVRMTLHDKVKLGQYEMTWNNLQIENQKNYQSTKATFTIRKNNQYVNTIYPEKRFYFVRQSTMTDAAVDVGFFRDIYIALGEKLSDGSWSVRLYEKPFIRWIWIGGLLMLLGGILAALNRSRQNRREENVYEKL